MKLAIWVSVVTLTLSGPESSHFAPGKATLPQPMQLRAYALHNSPNSADISPDERLVVSESKLQTERSDPTGQRFSEVIQVWNFKEDALVAEFFATEGDGQAPGHSAATFGTRIVRFSHDGDVVVALINQTVYILNATDLAKLRTIPLTGPDITTRNYAGMALNIKAFVSSLEISQDSQTVAILWASDFTFGRIDLYRLSSGAYILSWNTPEGWTGSINRLHWHPNGEMLIVAIPNATSCRSANHEPDIFAFDIKTGTIKYELTSGINTPRVAVTSDNRVLVVEGRCAGLFSHNQAKLRVFDLTSGRRLHDGSADILGVGESVSASADGKRFLASTGQVAKKFDWGDGYFDYVDVDRKFFVWNLTTYSGIVTSQNIPALNESRLELNHSGRYALALGKASFIFELP
jgi:WD40 repeat protein